MACKYSHATLQKLKGNWLFQSKLSQLTGKNREGGGAIGLGNHRTILNMHP